MQEFITGMPMMAKIQLLLNNNNDWLKTITTNKQ